jgi:hypothetical protein
MIPKIIHHIAPSDKSRWHPMWFKCYPTWRKHFADFEHKIWSDDSDIDELVRNHYPQYWQLYQDFPVHIMRLDFARFCILHKYGGIYADMDMFCYKNFYSELTHDLHIVEAPYGDEFLESSLMMSISEHNFWELCMDLSKHQFYTQVQKQKIQIPFNNDRSAQFIITTVAGPNLVCRVWRQQHHSGKIKTLPGVLYNNHGMSYHPEYKTKHMMTGMWGKEAMYYIQETSQTKNFQQNLADGYIKEMQQYVELNGVTMDTFDFYQDYTNGGMKTHFIVDMDKSDMDNQAIQFGFSYD